jgi:subtilisin family serine protease
MPDKAFLEEHGRRPVVGILDTGCGKHSWLDPVVTKDPKLGAEKIGYADEVPPPDPEQGGDWTGPLDGCLDPLSAHGTFIAGLVHQNCPDADILTWRVVKSEGPIVESDLVAALDDITEYAERGAAGDQNARPIDVLNLSMGYYHETPYDDALFDDHMLDLFDRLAKVGCTVVCSAGNDGTARPQFPAAFAGKADNCVSVGALNPNLDTVAIFSNTGDWVTCYAPGGAVLSTMPPFQGGLEPEARTRAYDWVRESIDPDNFQRRAAPLKGGSEADPDGGFALWSGTSFAAPVQAGRIAQALVGRLPTDRNRRTVSRIRRKAVQDAMPPGPPGAG